MTTDTILTTDRIYVDGSERSADCPHCKKFVNFPDGPVRGEQFKHSNHGGCNNWFYVDIDARMLRAKQ